jgi:hypothetical protein
VSYLDSAVPLERSQLHFSLPLAAETWVARIVRACEIIEGDPALPREPLSLAFKKDRLECIEDRAAYLEDLLDNPHRYLVLTNGNRLKFDRGGTPVDTGQIRISGVVNDTARQAYDLTVEFPAMPWSVRESLLAAIGDALDACTGQITPAPAAQAFTAHYLLGTVGADNANPARAGWERETHMLRVGMKYRSTTVPRIQHVSVGGGRQSPLQPAILGWINYWSAETCEYLGFPEAARDGDLLRYATQTPQGSWIVKLCDEPLDVSLEPHVEMVASVYGRFPRLGIRI